jgi:hypothetical protein
MDSEGQTMPFYAMTEYGADKFTRNPRNGGRWDLKLTGQYHSGIGVQIKTNSVLFTQKYRNKKVQWLNMMLDKANRHPLGIKQTELDNIQKENIPELKIQLLKIIHGK